MQDPSSAINGLMKEEHLRTEATLGLVAMRSEVSKYEDELPTITVMHMTCSAMRQVSEEADKGEYGALAVKILLRLWKNLKFAEITGENISELNAVVERMYAKTAEESRQAGASP